MLPFEQLLQRGILPPQTAACHAGCAGTVSSYGFQKTFSRDNPRRLVTCSSTLSLREKVGKKGTGGFIVVDEGFQGQCLESGTESLSCR